MKKNIAIIILSCIIALLIAGIITITVLHNSANKKLILDNEISIINMESKIKNEYAEILSNRDKKIKELENRKPVIKTITKEVLVNMSDASKDETIIDQNNLINNLQVSLEDCFQIINSDTILIDSLKADLSDTLNNLEKTNNALKNIKYPSWGFELFGSAVFNSGYNFNMITGINFKKYFLSGRFFIGGGASFNMEKNIMDINSSWYYGGGLNINLGFNF